MARYVVNLRELDRSQVALAGGKGANLGELLRIDGVRVPDGFCVTTEAFARIIGETPAVAVLVGRLSRLRADDRAAIAALSAELRAAIVAIRLPHDLATGISDAIEGIGAGAACAVRSSATAEDLPSASFAGQQDTLLNVVGTEPILRAISHCWASLFTERAVTYRLRNGIDDRRVGMAVVVQRMVFPEVSGIAFTADPISGNRTVTAIEASFGLGEALVSGLVNADSYAVRDGEVLSRAIGSKARAILAAPDGGTEEQAIAPGAQAQPALTDAQVVQLAALGRRIEAHFGAPQDIEWCLAGDGFHVVQSRPITTLFPIPDAGDDAHHVYLSVGHQQMMTDAMRPLGLSFWQMTTPRPMAIAGGRLFVDVTEVLAAPASRAAFLELIAKSDPLIRDAVETILARDGVLPSLPDGASNWAAPSAGPAPLEADPAIVAELITQARASIEATQREIATRSGPALLDIIEQDIQELRRVLFDPRSRQVYMSAIEAVWWLNEHLGAWLGEPNASDILTQSVPDNVTSEMGLALLDVADAIRPYPEVVAYLERVSPDDEHFLDDVVAVEGWREARDAIVGWLGKYGMRCVGEIDITRTRWSERPAMLVPLILGNIRNLEPGAAAGRFARGLAEARAKEAELLARIRAMPDGEQRAEETRRMIARVRTFIGYREFPKYAMISRYFVYKQALMAEAERLVRDGVLRDREDIHFLEFGELKELVRTRHVDEQAIRERKESFAAYQALRPPRVLTSDGECFTGAYRRDDLPAGALPGLAVSAGTVEGRARVVLDMADARVEPGDILVTAYTDPSWTPLFVSIAGLVTEVGGLMTHGAVVAREYGLPAVVGVEDATRLIPDGQRIRVHGTNGYVEFLP